MRTFYTYSSFYLFLFLSFSMNEKKENPPESKSKKDISFITTNLYIPFIPPVFLHKKADLFLSNQPIYLNLLPTDVAG